jgi:acyl-CoA thioesterase-2
MAQRESLWGKVPGYRVDLEPSATRRRARFRGAIVADSERALVVTETKHDAVVYFPREDVHLEHLKRTDHQTFCPFKGDASYWTLRVGDDVAENIAWSYEAPFDEVAGLKDYVSFYADRVDWDEG